MTRGTVTVFGGSGFVGRYLIRDLARAGWRIRIAVRRPAFAEFLRPAGDVGQIAIVAADVRDAGSVTRAVAGAQAVVNLVGILAEHGGQRFRSVQAEGAATVARAAADAGVRKLVQVSAIGADPDSPSAYGRSKAAGEAGVREAFPDAVILRPSIIFGAEDEFFNRFARLARYLPVMPLIEGATRFQPVYVGDVAQAVAVALEDDRAVVGKIYELGGPRVASFEDLLAQMMAEIGVRRPFLRVPRSLAGLAARFAQFLPGPPLTPDHLAMLARDNIAAPDAPGLAALGIRPTSLETVLPVCLRRYRPRGQFFRAGEVMRRDNSAGP